MSIDCYCFNDDTDYEYIVDEDYSEAENKTKCFTCKKDINKKEIILGLTLRGYEDEDDADDVSETRTALCEECGDLLLSIQDAEYCVTIQEGLSIKEDWLNA